MCYYIKNVCFARCWRLKSNLLIKCLTAICLCAVFALTFTACRDKEVFADTSDFESYPEYWNDFNDDIYVPNNSNSTTNNSSGNSSITPPSDDEDWTANFIEDDDESNTFEDTDTDNDGLTDNVDPDDDNDGIPDESDPDDDNDGTPDTDDVDNGNQGPFVPYKQ